MSDGGPEGSVPPSTPTVASPSDLPPAGEVLAEVTKDLPAGGGASAPSSAEDAYAARFSDGAVKRQAEYAHLKGIIDHYSHKGWWSYFLMALLFGMIGFQWFMLAKVGAAEWDFTQYEWLLPILLIQNLGQIIGLAIIVVRSLFKDMN